MICTYHVCMSRRLFLFCWTFFAISKPWDRQVGLCGNHAYSVLDLREIFDPRFMGRVWLSDGGACPLDKWNKKSLGSRMGLYWVVYKMICVTLYFIYIHMMVRVSIHSYYNNILNDKWMKQCNGTDTWIYVGHFSIYARFPVGLSCLQPWILAAKGGSCVESEWVVTCHSYTYSRSWIEVPTYCCCICCVGKLAMCLRSLQRWLCLISVDFCSPFSIFLDLVDVLSRCKPTYLFAPKTTASIHRSV